LCEKGSKEYLELLEQCWQHKKEERVSIDVAYSRLEQIYFGNFKKKIKTKT